MGILSWIILGLVAGALAKYLMDSDEQGWVFTMVLGIVGAFVGGYVGSYLGIGSVSGFSLRSIGVATGGAVLVLFVSRLIKRRK